MAIVWTLNRVWHFYHLLLFLAVHQRTSHIYTHFRVCQGQMLKYDRIKDRRYQSLVEPLISLSHEED